MYFLNKFFHTILFHIRLQHLCKLLVSLEFVYGDLQTRSL